MESYSNEKRVVKTRKQLAAEDTRRTIVEAAARMFSELGYRGTSIGRIASEAGVAVQTIYNAVGPKHEILSRVLDFAAAGDRAPVPVPEFMRERAESESDPRRIIALTVDFWRGALPRTAPIFRLIAEAAATDPEIAALERTRAAQRLHNYRQAAQILAERGALRPGLSTDDAAATFFAIGSPHTYRTLVLEGDWDDDHWAAWAGAALEAALLDGHS
jgi:AcrR family transcriptional regulator